MTFDPHHHAIATTLIDAGFSSADSFAPISERVRDRTDVYALRCAKSDVVILNRLDHINAEVYEDRGDLSYWGDAERAKLLETTSADDKRRADFIAPYIAGKSYLDIGTGLGGILDLVRNQARDVHALEPQSGPRDLLTKLGYRAFKRIDDAPAAAYDVISLFHVYEHIPDQIAFLEQAKGLLKPGGMIVIEVPHANDALLTLYESRAFLDFTLWSQHLILHTRETLRAFMTRAGFKDIDVRDIQRYPLSNHLHWLAKQKPGGHVAWNFLNDPALAAAYEKTLAARHITDTLLAVASL